jgi:hypothetical protein
MLVTIVVVWAFVIPIAVLAISWHAPDRPNGPSARADESVSAGKPVTAVAPSAHRAGRLSRIAGRRLCPELNTDSRRRRTSA